VFISHSSENLEDAKRIEVTLNAGGFNAWLDHSDIRVGVLLGQELQQAIKSSRAVVLIWSKAAAKSPWVMTEILTAFHLDRFILPYALDATAFPQFLSRSIHGDLRRNRTAALAKLPQDVGRAPKARNEFLGGSAIHQPSDLKRTIDDLDRGQRAVGSRLDSDDVAGAAKLQKDLDAKAFAAEKSQWRNDPTILSLAGYHRKNAYMIKHWYEYCAGEFPEDKLLRESRGWFFKSLLKNPLDYNALNGLGNILLFQGELSAAEFFVSSAIKCARDNGVDYGEAKHDLKLIQSRIRGVKS
jgi:hypothetical protein